MLFRQSSQHDFKIDEALVLEQVFGVVTLLIFFETVDCILDEELIEDNVFDRLLPIFVVSLGLNLPIGFEIEERLDMVIPLPLDSLDLRLPLDEFFEWECFGLWLGQVLFAHVELQLIINNKECRSTPEKEWSLRPCCS